MPVESKRSITNWAAFEKAGLFPTEVVCDGYKPLHPFNAGCHTRLPVRRRDESGKPIDTAEFVMNHAKAHNNPQVGGGFIMTFKRAERIWGGWDQLATAKMELTELRCDHCNAVIGLRPNEILAHLKPHAGKVKKSVIRNRFLLTIMPERPIVPDEDEDLI